MKRLYLLRHAQAMPSSDSGDKGRKLSPQGLMDSDALGQMMARKNYRPATVLSSPAIRTVQTWEQAAPALGGLPQKSLPRLYNGGYEAFIEALEDLDDSLNSALIIGHNPGIHMFAARLASEDSPASLMARLTEGFRPGTLAVFDCPVQSWLDLQDEQNTLIELTDPLDYNAPAGPTRWT